MRYLVNYLARYHVINHKQNVIGTTFGIKSTRKFRNAIHCHLSPKEKQQALDLSIANMGETRDNVEIWEGKELGGGGDHGGGAKGMRACED